MCKHANREYCYVPAKIAELDSATTTTSSKVESSLLLEQTRNHPLDNLVLRSAMQLATLLITHENTLPFWAGLLDSSTTQPTDVRRPFHVRARKRLSAAKAASVLEFLATEVASRICFHFRSFAGLRGGLSSHDLDGCCTIFAIWPDDADFDAAWPEPFNYAWRDGEAVMQADAFPHVFLNVDPLLGCDMSSGSNDDDWLDCTISEIRASIFRFAVTIGHEFAHAMVEITQNGGPPPRLNDEAVVETGFSWEDFVFGGRLDFEKDQLYVIPWPNYEGWKAYADGWDNLELRAVGRGALPLARNSKAARQVWERFLEQGFWNEDEAHSAAKKKEAFKKLSLGGRDVEYNKRHYCARERVSAPPKARRICLGEEEGQRRRIGAIQTRGYKAMAERRDRWDRVVDRAEERRNAFHQSKCKPLLNEFWASCTKHADEDVFL